MASSKRGSVRRHGGRGSRKGPGRKRARRFAIAAFSPATAVIALVLAVITLSVWSCSSDPVRSRRSTRTNQTAAADATSGDTLKSPPPSARIPGAPLFESEPDIRVRVKPGSESSKIESKVALQAIGAQMQPAPIASPFTVTCTPEGIRLLTSKGEYLQFPQGVVVTIASTTTGPDGIGHPISPAPNIKVDDVEYPGQVILRPTTDKGMGKFDVIVDMSIEDYLPGVLAKELFAKWPLGAYESQAVCARTYALFERALDRAAGRPFDVENTQADQVFGGATNNQTARQAVLNTRGAVLTFNGELFKAYYSSTCGGRSGSAADVWPITKGYEYNLAAPIQGQIRPHYCQQARLYRWEVTRRADELGARFAAWGRINGHPVRTIGPIQSVTVEKVNATTRPGRYTVVDSRQKTYSMSAEELRVACNVAADGFTAITPQTRVNSSDVEFTSSTDNGIPIFMIRGRGFGHGVGMCQWCLKGMADAGIPWNEQVLTFYPGATIVKGYR
jgi:stage II sporulation protein D